MAAPPQEVTSANEALQRRVEAVLDMAVTTVSSLSEAFTSGAPAPPDEGAAKDAEGPDAKAASLPPADKNAAPGSVSIY